MAEHTSSAPERPVAEAPRRFDPSVPAGERGPFKSLILWEEMQRAAIAQAEERERPEQAPLKKGTVPLGGADETSGEAAEKDSAAPPNPPC